MINEPTLITGGSGLLGRHLIPYFANVYAPSHTELDIANTIDCDFKPKYIVHCAALKTIVCDEDPLAAMCTNILGTINITNFAIKCKAKLIYISTDYVFSGNKGNYKVTDELLPQNYYAETKLAGEYVAKCLPQHLIIRLSFGPDQYPYDNGFIDQFTTRMPVSIAASKIIETIKLNKTGVIHLAGPRQSVYDYAISTSQGKSIKPRSINDDLFKRPKDTSLSEDVG